MKLLPRIRLRLTLCGLLAWTTAIALAMGYLRTEWTLAPNASGLLGPLWIAWYGGVAGWILAIVLLPSVLAFLLKPHPITALISSIAFALWLFLGMVGRATGC
jgi:hypothetical protein